MSLGRKTAVALNTWRRQFCFDTLSTGSSIDGILNTMNEHQSPKRRRRAVALPQASIARAIKAAQSAGATWHVEIDGDIIRMFQGAPTRTQNTPPEIAKDAPEKTWRL
jgi:hypothetical protein